MYPNQGRDDRFRTTHVNEGDSVIYDATAQASTFSRRGPSDQSRPLETRPAPYASNSDASVSRIQRGLSHIHAGPYNEPRAQGQNLPGLRDILSPDPQIHAQSPLDSRWDSRPALLSDHRSSDATLPAFRAPPMLPPVTDRAPMYQRYSSSHDLSNPEPSAAPSYRQAPPLPPYPAQPTYARTYPDARPTEFGQPSPNSSIRDSISSPYHGVANHETQQSPAESLVDRAIAYASGHATNEGHVGYLGLGGAHGEGQYHVYEDGSRLPTHIDGEKVNPAWGLTKAMKPRKRLAMACLDCREKKIRCEPSPGKLSCVQCEKAMRLCRKAPEKFSNVELASSVPTNTAVIAPKSTQRPAPSPSYSQQGEASVENRRRSREDLSPRQTYNKKHRSISPQAQQAPASHASAPSITQTELQPRQYQGSRESHGNSQRPNWEDDPFESEPEMTDYLLDLYFSNVNNATYCMFPRQSFIGWAKVCRRKRDKEKMLLYAMLAMGSKFGDDKHANFGKECASYAGSAISAQVGKFDLLVAQSQLIVSLYHYALGSNDLAYNYGGSAITGLVRMGLNKEEACQLEPEISTQTRLPFNFGKHQLAECKRRTFWVAFVEDRYTDAELCMIKPEDVFLRLPCSDRDFEENLSSTAPFFANRNLDTTHAEAVTRESPLSPAAWHVLVLDIFGDIVDFKFRVYRTADADYRNSYEPFYNTACARLRAWLNRLPDKLRYTAANLDRSIHDDYVGTFLSLHVLYHRCFMKLNRYLRHEIMQDVLLRNIQVAHVHARAVLKMVCDLQRAQQKPLPPTYGRSSSFTFTTICPSFGILAAIDIVSAGGWEGTLSRTRFEIESGTACLRELALYWASAQAQARLADERCKRVQNLLTRPYTSKGGAWLGKLWGMVLPVEYQDPAHDCIFGLSQIDGLPEPVEGEEPNTIYFNALKNIEELENDLI